MDLTSSAPDLLSIAGMYLRLIPANLNTSDSDQHASSPQSLQERLASRECRAMEGAPATRSLQNTPSGFNAA